MIEIIKKGKKKEVTKTFSCSTCDCEFKATEEHWKDISQYGPIVYGTNCPNCKHLAKEKIER